MDTRLTGVAVDVANIGANYELVFSHRCVMRVNSKNIDRDRDIYRYRYMLIER